MPQFTDIWEVTPETAHPRARQLLSDSNVWDYGDEDSPLGNDTGADTFAAYLTFRAEQPSAGVQEFIREQLASLGVSDADWDLLDGAGLQAALEVDNGFSTLTRDDFIIGLAFAQFLVEGTVDAEVKRRAQMALRRQATGVVLSFRGGGSEDARKRQLMELHSVLESI